MQAHSSEPSVQFAKARPAAAASIAALRNAAADRLTSRFGKGPWSVQVTECGVLSSMRDASVFVGRVDRRIVAVARLGTRKPWSIDVAYFTPCRRPLYLTDMAVALDWQGKGVGRRCLTEVIRVSESWPADALRLDAYDAPAGAGGFYARCGFANRGHATYRGTPHVYFELLLPHDDGALSL